MLKQRILTALILIPITLILLFFLPPSAFCIVTGLVTLGAAFEWTNLMGLNKLLVRLVYVTLFAIVMIGILFIPIPLILLSAFVWWLFAAGLVFMYPRCNKWWGNSVFWRGLIGVFVLVPCWVAINFIREQIAGVYTLIFLLVLIWSADSTAYFVGKKWGKNKLLPAVSPGKSIQGLIGALFFSIVISLGTFWLCNISLSIWPWGIALSMITVLFSVVGDLTESMLKRTAGLKDSGHLLPGHGGLLDRIDSLTAAAPIFVLGAILLGMYLN